MKQKIKILHLEDTETDAELIARELRKEKIDAEIDVVYDKSGFKKALKDFNYDVILSDHSLASFNSFEALSMVKKAGITVPFILVTAVMNDEFAAKVMREGASDYILKDRLRRLPGAIINSIDKQLLEVEKEVASERLFFHIENTPLGFIEWDNKWQLTSISKRAKEIFGWGPEDYNEDNGTEYMKVYEDDLLAVTEMADSLLTGNVDRNTIQSRYYSKNGNIIWCEWFNSVLKDKDGNVITIMSLVQDITESKTFEARMAYNDSRLQEAQAIAHVASWEIDVLNNTEVWSDEMYRILGVKQTFEPSSKSFSSFIHPDDLDSSNSAFRTLNSASLEFRVIRKYDGATRYVHAEWRYEFDKKDKPSRIYGIIQDITERKVAEIERSKIVNDLTLKNRDLEQFSYIISHNLRSPVANIIGLLSVMNQPELTDSEKEIIGRGINESVTRLDDIVKDLNHILEIKKEIDNTNETIRFSELVDDIKMSIMNLLESDIVISYDFSEINGFFTLKSFFYSIFYNLISNSIKYRRPQTRTLIEIKSRLIENKLELTFADNGMGINLNKSGDQVFSLYKRFHTNIEGKGMGLFMVKTQVETLGGKITIQSEENVGTEFKIEFDL
ncbi:MAG: domain S-box protein [Mucilaginibacter sp.]|nr:domain S-box protein [Mucilaginibacter sp.]